ncbi:MAG: hypothetical protein PUI84_04415 [Bacteroidales bacterium]|nr:hypothetical protein [Bacteroidales bacterium]
MPDISESTSKSIFCFGLRQLAPIVLFEIIGANFVYGLANTNIDGFDDRDEYDRTDIENCKTG